MSPRQRVEVGQLARLCASPETGLWPCARDAAVAREIGRVVLVQQAGGRTRVTLRFAPVGRDVNRLLTVYAEYVVPAQGEAP